MTAPEESVPTEDLDATFDSDPYSSIDPDLTTDQPTPRTPSEVDATIDSGGSAESPAESPAALEATSAPNVDVDPALETQLRQRRSALADAWKKSKQPPSLKDFLPEPGEGNADFRDFLAGELVKLDIEYRKMFDASLSEEQYVSQLPEFRDAISRAYQECSGDTSHTQVVDGAEMGGKAMVARHAGDPNARYRATKLHARGGLGAVFRARDEELNRLVALKEILPEHSSKPQYQEKFLFEAEITGSLEHPGIVPVYGLGRYSDDQPYYAMRFIRGEPFGKRIRAFHGEDGTPHASSYLEREFRALLRRLIDTCNAMHFAHEHGVLHRDLKPDNIMLGEYGETLVVDWGLAKQVEKRATEPAPPDDTTMLGLRGRDDSSKTRQGSIVGTPMYMSPEQAMGRVDDLDSRTDIYALGAILFYLVTGQRPIDGRTSVDVIRNVRVGKVRLVSDIAPSAPAALGSLCRKAMALDPEDRYDTAVELAEDIERWMNDELVLAHASHEGLLERSGRLIRRYRSWTISGAAALLLITLVAIGAAVLIDQARKQERIAKIQANESQQRAVERYRSSREAIDTWLVQSSDALKFFPETQALRERLLEQAMGDYERLAEFVSNDPELELERGRVLVRVGDLMQMKNDEQAALNAYERASRIFLAGLDNDDLGIQFRNEGSNVLVRQGISYANLQRLPDAKTAFQEAIDALSGPSGGTAEDSRAAKIRASAHLNMGKVFSGQAAEQLGLALEGYRSAADPNDFENRLGAAHTFDVLGQLHRDQGDFETASSHLRDSEQLLQRLVLEDPDHPEYLNALASVFVSKAAVYRAQGLENLAIDSISRAVDYYRALCAAQPRVLRSRYNLAVSLTDISLVQHESGQNIEADKTSGEADQLFTQLIIDYGQAPRMLEAYATCLDARGQILLVLREAPGDAAFLAEKLLLQLLDRASTDDAATEQQIMLFFERLAIAQSHLARTYHRLGDVDNAKLKFEESLQRLDSLINVQGPLPRFVNAKAHTHRHYGNLLHSQSDADAAGHFQSARDLWINLGEARTADHCEQLALLLATCPDATVIDLDAAADFADQAASLAPSNSRFLVTRALVASLADQNDQAIAFLETATKQRAESTDRALFIRAIALAGQGNVDQAKSAFNAAIQWQSEQRPFDDDIARLRTLAEERLRDSK